MNQRNGFPWAQVLWFAILLAALFWPVFQTLVRDWTIDEDMSHGFLVPVVAGYCVWQQREQLLVRSYTPNYWGLVIVLLAGLQLLAGTLGVELFVMRTSLIVCLAGVLVTLGGLPLIRQLLFPLLLLLFMIPIPAVIYNQITFPLQMIASQVAESVLNALGIPVLREGNILELPSQKLSVVEACSGIRSLLSLSFLALVYGYLATETTLLRALLFVLTIPIAIFANSFRVTLTGIIGERDPELARGVFHSLEGWVVFMFALLLLVATHRVIRMIWRRPDAGNQ